MLIWIYLIVVNIITFFLYAEDKRRARCGQWRIAESTLLLLALIGGAPGAYASMWIFHHKTRKWKFRIGIPVMILIQVLLGWKIGIW